MRIRDAITIATAGTLAITAVTAITIIGSVAPTPPSFRCAPPPAPIRPKIESRIEPEVHVEPTPTPIDCNEWWTGHRQDMPPPRCQSSD